MGRPTKLTKKVQETIVTLIRAGCFKFQAAQQAGVADSTVDNWLKWGRAGGPDNASAANRRRFAAFAAEYDRAVAEAENRAATMIYAEGIKGDLDSLRWWLEHGPAKKRWAQASEVEHSGPGGGPIDINATGNNLASKINALAASLAKSSG